MHNILKMTGLGEEARWDIAGSTQSLEKVLIDPSLILQQAGQINLHYTCHHVEASGHRDFKSGEWLFIDIDQIPNYKPEMVAYYRERLAGVLNIGTDHIWGISSGNGVHLLIRIPNYNLEYLEVHKATYTHLSQKLKEVCGVPEIVVDPVFHKSKSLRLPHTLNRKPDKPDTKCELIFTGVAYEKDLLTIYRQSYDANFNLDNEVKRMASMMSTAQKNYQLPAVLQDIGLKVNGVAPAADIISKCSFVAKLENDLAFLSRDEWLRGVSLLTTLGMEKEAHEWSSKSGSYKVSETDNIINSAKEKGLHPTSCEKIGQTFNSDLTKGCATCPYKTCKSPAKLFNDPTLLAMSRGFYEYHEVDGKLKRGKLNFKEMGNFCNKYLHIFNVHEHEQVYAWDFNDLIYEKMSRESMSKKFNDLIQPTLIDPTQTKLKGYDTMAIEHSVKEITVLPPEGFVPLKNGWLNVLKGDLENYSPKYLVTQKIPVNYDPIAACPRFEKFLEERIGDKETIEVLLEYICYALCGIRYPNRKILVLEGPKGTGKTTIITMLQNLFGHLSTMSQLQHLTGRFETSMFENKRLVLFDEAPTGKDQNLIELLKNLSGSPYIKIERKNENAMTVQNLARLIIACNEIPRGGAIDSGFMDRLLIVPMHNAIETYNMIEANQMIEEELSGILNLILKRFSRLKLKNFNIDQTALTQEQANTYQKDNDPIAQFMSTELDFVQHIIQTNEDIQINSKRGTLETTISLSNFRKEFIRWAESENPYYRTMSSVTVRKHLEVLSKTVFKKKFTLKNTNLGWFLVGIRFKNRELLENPRRDNAEY